ncbi:MAG: hypothetical protein HQ542_11380, partial [Bacteroidia bacterium]|nr:hypothetical protein [Bacteroidia bacterium]
MMRTFIIAISFLVAFAAHTQNHINFADNALVPGESAMFTEIAYVAPGEAGPNQIWNFSGINMSGEPLSSY